MEKKLNYIKAIEVFEKKIELPEDPGIYKFFNANFELLYVGKAKNLKNREFLLISLKVKPRSRNL